jgi:hypothetical protein
MRSLLAVFLATATTLCQADQILVEGDVVSSHTPVHRADNAGPMPLYGSMGVCTVFPALKEFEAKRDSPRFLKRNDLYPEAGAGQIFPEARFDAELQADIEAATIQLLQKPKHGVLAFTAGHELHYLPLKNYVGNDKAIFLVNINTHPVRVVYYIKVVSDGIRNYEDFKKNLLKYCPKTEWRIISK